MTQTSEFDPHASIKWLAEQEWPCPFYHSANIEPACVHSSPHCPSCQCRGTSIVVPFAVLRASCRNVESYWIEEPSLPLNPISGTRGVTHPTPCVVCKNRHWVSEPDVRVACWEILKANPKIAKEFYSHSMSGAWYWYDNKNAPNHKGWTRVDTAEEALLRTAEARVKEHKA